MGHVHQMGILLESCVANEQSTESGITENEFTDAPVINDDFNLLMKS